MSRTRHHGDKAKERVFGIDNWNWFSNEPKWWNKLHHVRPHRRATREAEREAATEGDAVFPVYGKPHQYYW